jgi:hypothetical protein
MITKLQNSLHLLRFKIIVRELLGHKVDVLTCLAGIEKQKFESVIGREEFLVCFYQEF